LTHRIPGQQRGRPLKIVYAGVRGSGKSANLRAIADCLKDPAMAGLANIIDYSLDNALMDFLFLDFTPRFSEAVRVLVLTLSPTLQRETCRDVLVGGVDGVVLVIDSNVDAFQTNVRAMREISETLAMADAKRKSSTPVIIQYNKRDVGERLPLRYLQSRLNQNGYPWVASVAARGRGVLSTFRSIISSAIEARDARMTKMAGY